MVADLNINSSYDMETVKYVHIPLFPIGPYIKFHSSCILYILNSQRTKIASEYDQEIPQSQTADNPVAPRGRAAQPPRDTRTTN